MTALELLDYAIADEAPPHPRRRSLKRLLLPLFREVAGGLRLARGVRGILEY